MFPVVVITFCSVRFRCAGRFPLQDVFCYCNLLLLFGGFDLFEVVDVPFFAAALCFRWSFHLWLARVTSCEAGVFFWWRYLWLSRYLVGCGLCFVAPWCIPRPHDFVFRNVASVRVFLSLMFLFS